MQHHWLGWQVPIATNSPAEGGLPHNWQLQGMTTRFQAVPPALTP